MDSILSILDQIVSFIFAALREFNVFLTEHEAIVGVIIGSGITFLIDEIRYRRKVSNKRKNNLLKQIKNTRIYLQAQVDWLTEVSLGHLDEGKAAQTLVMSVRENSDFYLIGDDAVAKAYFELLFSIRRRFGKTHRKEDQIESIATMFRVSEALSKQAGLAEKGRPLLQISSKVRSELSNVQEMADKMGLVAREPVTEARLAGLVFKHGIMLKILSFFDKQPRK
jgi:hypothetical protein